MVLDAVVAKVIFSVAIGLAVENQLQPAARATNDDPLSALSVQRIGKRTAPIIRLDNIASQAALQEYVDNRNQL